MISAKKIKTALVVKPLISLLNESGTQLEAIEALGTIGRDAKDAIDALTTLKLDSNKDVREAAAAALKKIK